MYFNPCKVYEGFYINLKKPGMWTLTQAKVKINIKMKREHLVGKFVLTCCQERKPSFVGSC